MASVDDVVVVPPVRGRPRLPDDERAARAFASRLRGLEKHRAWDREYAHRPAVLQRKRELYQLHREARCARAREYRASRKLQARGGVLEQHPQEAEGIPEN